MKVEIICNKCKRIIKVVEKETFDYHHKDYCDKCNPTN